LPHNSLLAQKVRRCARRGSLRMAAPHPFVVPASASTNLISLSPGPDGLEVTPPLRWVPSAAGALMSMILCTRGSNPRERRLAARLDEHPAARVQSSLVSGKTPGWRSGSPPVSSTRCVSNRESAREPVGPFMRVPRGRASGVSSPDAAQVARPVVPEPHTEAREGLLPWMLASTVDVILASTDPRCVY